MVKFIAGKDKYYETQSTLNDSIRPMYNVKNIF